MLLQQTSPAGAEISFDGQLSASRASGSWQFTPSGPLFPENGHGMPKSSFEAKVKGKVFAVDDPGDLAQIKALVQSESALLSNLDKAKDEYLAERKAKQQEVINALLAKIAPGTIFLGTATSNDNKVVPLFFEVRDLNPSKAAITFLLRNDGGWTDFRVFHGAYAFNSESESLRLTLTTRYQDMVQGAGPFLDSRSDWTILFELDGDRLVQERSNIGSWTYAFDRLADEDAAKQKADLEADHAAVMAATAPGSVYRGTFVAKDHSRSYEFLIRFKPQTNKGAIISAELCVPKQPASGRIFKGTMLPTTTGTKGTPYGWKRRKVQELWLRLSPRVPLQPGGAALMCASKLRTGT